MDKREQTKHSPWRVQNGVGESTTTLSKFKIANERSETFTYDISISVVKVYNEQIMDLLALPTTLKNLEGLHHVSGLVESKVENIEEVWNMLQTGNSAQVGGSNNVNEHNNRPHW
ncbi:hypothetical protein T459_14413 [Capsicum annuum]|uniref:Kinesin motor domain-containing protein n=1 Tax=Capsicum annuum TaxID=4072 RepID=A0A2G2ZHD6_CAPAN|nr:hypothetical protein T459_14413 [Capsicum annuum]